MNKTEFKSRLLPGGTLMAVLSIVVSLILLSSSVFAETSENNRQIIRQVARKLIQSGSQQYNRGSYKLSEQSLMRARSYKGYLTAVERQELDNLIAEVSTALAERERITAEIRSSRALAAQGNLNEAREVLESIMSSTLINAEEKQMIEADLSRIDRLSKRPGSVNEETLLYDQSIEYYMNGDLERAKGGFQELLGEDIGDVYEGTTPEDYLLKIELAQIPVNEPDVHDVEEFTILEEYEYIEPEGNEFILFEPDTEGVIKEEIIYPIEEIQVVAQTEPVEIEIIDMTEGISGEIYSPSEQINVIEPSDMTENQEDDYIEVVNRKRNIIRGFTKVAVNDAISKAQKFTENSEYDKAVQQIDTAKRIVNENHLNLGEYIFEQYTNDLKQALDRISIDREQMTTQMEEERRQQAIEAQRQRREQMEIDREKRIADLMDSATAYQKQQRYEEALGQLQSLLAINPLNERALVLRQTLEDMSSFREQIKLQNEADEQRYNTLLKTDEAGIPYADEMTHPKNWNEIVAKPTRQPDEALGVQDAATREAYKQLEETVDLSRLTPEMSFSEAIEEIKASVSPPLRIVVLWRDLYDNADIDQTTVINMDGIAGIPLGSALELVLKSVAGGFAELDYAVSNGIITIATVDSLPDTLYTSVYDVTILLGQPADFYARSGGTATTTGGGSGGTGGSIFSEYFDEENDEIDRAELAEKAKERTADLISLIQETIEPDGWYETGNGEGTVKPYPSEKPKKLIVYQSREVHKKIERLLKDMQKSLGHQVAIEARFLEVGENFLEDIGLDLDFRIDVGGKFGFVDIKQNSSSVVRPQSTGVSGSLGYDTIATVADAAMGIGGHYGGLLDDLQVNFLIRATQSHRDSKALTAPKVTVLSGESATIRVQRTIRFAMPPDMSSTNTGGGIGGTTTQSSITQNIGIIPTGTILNITPTITPDKKHVLLNIVTELRHLLELKEHSVELPIVTSGNKIIYTVTLPDTEISRIKTRVSVPDGGTLLLGGQKITADVERESGVPIMSKIPIFGRLFDNRSKIKDSRILLVLVKPTIILQEEADLEAAAAMRNDF